MKVMLSAAIVITASITAATGRRVAISRDTEIRNGQKSTLAFHPALGFGPTTLATHLDVPHSRPLLRVNAHGPVRFAQTSLDKVAKVPPARQPVRIGKAGILMDAQNPSSNMPFRIEDSEGFGISGSKYAEVQDPNIDRWGIPGSRLGPRQDWAQLNTRRQDVYFEELEGSIAILEATDPNLVAASYAGDDDAVASDPFALDVALGAELWPASFVAAKSVLSLLRHDREDLPARKMGQGKKVIELACGVGLPSLAALSTGATVTSTDYSPVSLDLVSKSAKLLPDGATQRHNIVNLDLFDNPMLLLDQIQPDIVVANEVHYGDPRLARAVGRFMGAAAARGAGVVASVEAGKLRWDSADGWDIFFDAFNDAVYEFHKHPELLVDTNLASIDRVREEKIPGAVINNAAGNGLLAKVFGQKAAVFEMEIGELDMQKVTITVKQIASPEPVA